MPSPFRRPQQKLLVRSSPMRRHRSIDAAARAMAPFERGTHGISCYSAFCHGRDQRDDRCFGRPGARQDAEGLRCRIFAQQGSHQGRRSDQKRFHRSMSVAKQGEPNCSDTLRRRRTGGLLKPGNPACRYSDRNARPCQSSRSAPMYARLLSWVVVAG
jgi:hypothetical protein